MITKRQVWLTAISASIIIWLIVIFGVFGVIKFLNRNPNLTPYAPKTEFSIEKFCEENKIKWNRNFK